MIRGKGNHGQRLSPLEFRQLSRITEEYPTKTSLAIIIGIDRNVLDRLLLTGSGSAYTIDKVKKFLNA